MSTGRMRMRVGMCRRMLREKGPYGGVMGRGRSTGVLTIRERGGVAGILRRWLAPYTIVSNGTPYLHWRPRGVSGFIPCRGLAVLGHRIIEFRRT